mmetsp:Transcript_8745/g.16537  ORF Transcript_8745/g.16537 Transcript_8745/m.16537 type:complete len:410 (-) Transcript_8745:146-1375(-)
MTSWQLPLSSLFWATLILCVGAPAPEIRWPSKPWSRATDQDEISLLQTGLGLQVRELPRPLASPADVESDGADWLDDAALTPPEPLPFRQSTPSDLAKLPSLPGAAADVTDSLGLDASLSDLAEATRLPQQGAASTQSEPNTFALPSLPDPDQLAGRFVAAADASSRGHSASSFAKSYMDTYGLSWPSGNSDGQRPSSDASLTFSDAKEGFAGEAAAGAPEAAQTQQAALESLRRQDDALREAEAEIREQAAAQVRLTLQAAAERVHDTLTKAREAIAAEEEHHMQVAGDDRLAAMQMQRMTDEAAARAAQPATLVPFQAVNTTTSDNCGTDAHHVECGTWNRILTLNYRMSILGGVLCWIGIVWLSCTCGSCFSLAVGFEGWMIGIIQTTCCFLLLAFVGILYLEWHY